MLLVLADTESKMETIDGHGGSSNEFHEVCLML